jgi:hypothetical protein
LGAKKQADNIREGSTASTLAIYRLDHIGADRPGQGDARAALPVGPVASHDDLVAVEDDSPRDVAERAGPEALAEEDEELPVVARMVVEIRSDGTRTVARGALDDRASGQQVALRFDAASPLSLAKSLAKAIVSVPSIARSSWRARLRRKALRGKDD